MNHKYMLMSSNKNDFPGISGTVNNFESNLVLEKIDIDFSQEDWNITQLLSMLPKHKASDNFDRKMAAAFSIELEREVQQKNSERIRNKN